MRIGAPSIADEWMGCRQSGHTARTPPDASWMGFGLAPATWVADRGPARQRPIKWAAQKVVINAAGEPASYPRKPRSAAARPRLFPHRLGGANRQRAGVVHRLGRSDDSAAPPPARPKPSRRRRRAARPALERIGSAGLPPPATCPGCRRRQDSPTSQHRREPVPRSRKAAYCRPPAQPASAAMPRGCAPRVALPTLQRAHQPGYSPPAGSLPVSMADRSRSQSSP